MFIKPSQSGRAFNACDLTTQRGPDGLTMTKTIVLGVLALLSLCTVYHAVSDVPRHISPHGCRMSWMSPSYLSQSEFNTSWTPLASRYSFWLYREVGWEPTQVSRSPSSAQADPTGPLAHGRACAVHSRECRLIAPSTLNCLLRCTTVLFLPVSRLRGVQWTRDEATRRVCRSVLQVLYSLRLSSTTMYCVTTTSRL